MLEAATTDGYVVRFNALTGRELRRFRVDGRPPEERDARPDRPSLRSGRLQRRRPHARLDRPRLDLRLGRRDPASCGARSASRTRMAASWPSPPTAGRWRSGPDPTPRTRSGSSTSRPARNGSSCARSTRDLACWCSRPTARKLFTGFDRGSGDRLGRPASGSTGGGEVRTSRRGGGSWRRWRVGASGDLRSRPGGGTPTEARARQAGVPAQPVRAPGGTSRSRWC